MKRFRIVVTGIIITLMFGMLSAYATYAKIPTKLSDIEHPESHLNSVAQLSGNFAYINKQGRLRIVTTNRSWVVPSDGNVVDFSWDSSGSRIAMILQNKNDATIGHFAVYSLVDNKLEYVPQYDDFFLSIVSWAPQGARILLDYGSGSSGRELKVISAEGWDNVLRKAHAHGCFWSPNGRNLAYAIENTAKSPVMLDNGLSNSLIVTNMINKSDTILKAGTSQELYWPNFWISNNLLVYTRMSLKNPDNPTYSMWQLNISNHKQKILSSIPFPYNETAIKNTLRSELKDSFGEYTWSNDKRLIGFSCYVDGDRKLYIMDSIDNKPCYIARGTLIRWSPAILK